MCLTEYVVTSDLVFVFSWHLCGHLWYTPKGNIADRKRRKEPYTRPEDSHPHGPLWWWTDKKRREERAWDISLVWSWGMSHKWLAPIAGVLLWAACRASTQRHMGCCWPGIAYKTKIRLRSSKNSFFKVTTVLLTEVDMIPWLAIYNSK